MEKDFTKPYNPEDTKQDFQEKKGPNKNLVKRLFLAGALGIGAFLAIPKGRGTDQVKETTSTYQGYTIDKEEGKIYLVFDDKIKETRQGPADLVIAGKPDTLKIGTNYTIDYTVNRLTSLPKKIVEIKYAKHSK